MKLRLIKDRILLRKIQPSKSDGYGHVKYIAIPEDHEKEFKFCGEVVALGPSVDDLSVGDTVIYRPFNEFAFDTGSCIPYAIIRRKDVITGIDQVPDYLSVVPWDAREYDEVV